MAITDPISDMFTRIRNALLIKNDEVVIPYSGIKLEIAKLLKEDGYIRFFEVQDEQGKKSIKVGLKYDTKGTSVISEMVRSSRPGKRIYVKKKHVPKVLNGIGLSILSTSK